MKNNEYPGYQPHDYTTPYGAFFKDIQPTVPEQITTALHTSPVDPSLLKSFSAAALLAEDGYQEVESGFAQYDDGSVHVAILTPMPGVSPKMWDWWFGWHGSSNSRYKLWHPKAHISAVWEDGKDDMAYIGRNSLVKEYIGNNLLHAAVQFKSPVEFGIPTAAVTDKDKAVYICARIGHPTQPVDYGYLIHQIRATSEGAEMRSRFWLGGRYAGLRQSGVLASALSGIFRKLRSLPANFGTDMLAHCAEEMNHLAAFLPELYAKYHPEPARLTLAGKVTERSDNDFEKIVLSTLFNKTDPGKRPERVVEPKTIDDIIQTIRYARSKGKKITVCSGGHSFSANHMRDDSTLILMKNFNEYHIDPAAMTATAGPGVGGSVLMTELYKHQLFFPAGHCKGVCIGGYLLQGGYGWNGRKLGIACQSVIGLDIVTADGDLVHADAQNNSDLFWAARGAGPGFFGVVVKFYLKLYPLPKFRAIIVHDFYMKHLEEVYNWAYEVGPTIPKAVEFQMIMSKKMMNLLGPGIEALAPIFADTRDEFEEAMAFMKNSPIKNKAIIATPAFDPGIDRLYKSAMEHYPENHHWGVDNMWTHSSIDDLMPFIKEIAATLPPAPSHFLWLNWHPGNIGADMAYSNEDKTYLALYANWKTPAETAIYGEWSAEMMRRMAHLSTGIQLADEGLHKRTAPFLSDAHLKKLQEIRVQRDPHGIFHEWHSRPQLVG